VEKVISGLDPQRTYFYRVRATSASGTQYGDVLNTSGVYDGFSLWKIAHFGNPNPADLDDPDQDGVPLLTEYALAMSPVTSDPQALPKAGGPLNNRLTITFQRDTSHTGVDIYVEASFLLTGPWNTIASSTNGGPFIGPVIGDSTAPGIHTITVRDIGPIMPDYQRFLRVRVVR
jgi:hypothetical protein